MRIIAPLALVCLAPVAALADSGVTSVDDEPVSHLAAAHAERRDHRAPADVGELRSARVNGPGAVDVDDGPGVAREHDVALARTSEAVATSSELQAELALRQMRRHERALDACVAAAHKRAPAAAGNLTLDFDVSDRKVRSVVVSEDSVRDAALAACLTSAARGFSFSLAAARFRWPVAVR